MKRNPAVTEATKAAIRDAFWTLYQQKSTDQITVKEITDLAGYNRSTFYQYYKDVYDVMEQIQEIIFNSIEAFSRLAITTGHEKSLLEIAQSFLDSQKDVQPYLVTLLIKENDPVFERRLIEWVKSLFQQLFSWEETDPMLQDFYMEYHINGVLGIMKHAIRKGEQPTLDQLITSLAMISGHSIVELTTAPFANQLHIKAPKEVEKG